MLENIQIKIGDISDEYRSFLEKFKPKKTTDDCYTPENVYQAVLDWAVLEYGINPDNVVRPFWPGADYERFDYPEGCTVVDNPPFSRISEIVRTYTQDGINFFLFAPYLTNFNSQAQNITHVITDIDIMYENGATVNTAFLTNLEPGIEIRTAPALRAAILDADRANRKEKARELPRYIYPPEVVTSTMIGYLSKHGQDLKIKSESCHFIRALESQKKVGKTLFGSGYLISEKAAAEKAAAINWELSDSEIAVIKALK